MDEDIHRMRNEDEELTCLLLLLFAGCTLYCTFVCGHVSVHFTLTHHTPDIANYGINFQQTRSKAFK